MYQQLLIAATSLAAGLTVAALVAHLDPALFWGPGPARTLARFQASAGQPRAREPLAFDPDRLILASLGLPDRPELLTWLRVASGGLPTLGLLAAGFPPILALGGGGLCAVLAAAALKGRWRRFRVRLEAELPTFVSRLAGTLLVTASPLAALEEVTATLAEDTPLRLWLDQLLAGLRVQGHGHLLAAREQAAGLSPSLGLVVFELGRCFETGGAGFVRAFTTTADQLSAVLEARAVAGSKAESARGAVLTMLVIMSAVLILMLSADMVKVGFRDPTAQLVAAVSLAVMAYGYVFLNGMIDDALE